jgi:hypothetical protein
LERGDDELANILVWHGDVVDTGTGIPRGAVAAGTYPRGMIVAVTAVTAGSLYQRHS